MRIENNIDFIRQINILERCRKQFGDEHLFLRCLLHKT